MVKQWKLRQSQPLSEREFYLLCQGVKWFGESTNRWALIARCFLPGRTVKFIQVEFSAIVTDFDKSNRFGRMMLLDVPDEKLITLAKDIPEKLHAEIPALPASGSARKSKKKPATAEEPIDITEGLKEQPASSAAREDKEASRSGEKGAKTPTKSSISKQIDNIAASAIDATMEIIRKKVQVFEEVDIDRISEFVTISDEQELQLQQV